MDGQNFNNESNNQQTGQQQPVYQQPVQQYQQYQQPVYQQTTGPVSGKANGLSIAGLVVGIVSICLFCMSWLGSLIGVVGLVLAIVGQVKNKSKLGIAAIVVSAIGVALGLIFLFIILSIMGSAAGSINDLMRYIEYYN